MRAAPGIAVIGVGNPLRRDDGVGLEVVERARPRLPQSATVETSAGDPAVLLEAWTGIGLAVAVDAARWPGAAPGEVIWIENAASSTGPLRWSDPGGTHGLGLAQAIGLGRALGRLPERLAVLAVAIDDDGLGVGLSASVAAAVGRAADILIERLGAVASERLGAVPGDGGGEGA
jgi:hydrogenase maturation protease